MSQQQEMLLDLARRIAAEQAARPGVAAILLTGSVAQGYGDPASDIDMMLYYDILPDEATFEALKAAALATGGNIYGHTPGEGLACYQYIDGVKVDMAHQHRDGLAEMLANFLEKPEVDNMTQHIIMSGVQTGLPLHGEELLRGWQAQLAALPAGFAAALVARYLRFYPVSVMAEMAVARGDLAFTYELLLESAKHILYVLCALNDIVPPGKIKGLDRSLRRMTIAPVDIVTRMDALWTLPPADLTAALYGLIDELIELVAAHLPAADTEGIRRRLQIPVRQPAAGK